MKKKIFLLLPEKYPDANICSQFPSTDRYYHNLSDDYVLMNVYEYYRGYHGKKKATELSLELLSAFDELWYYGAFGITMPMRCIIKMATQLGLPTKDLQPLSCKDSFSLAYKFALAFHPSQEQNDDYWARCIKACGAYTEDGNPLSTKLLVSILEYYEKVYRGEFPPVQQDNLFKADFRTALNFATWAIKNNTYFEGDIDPRKVSASPTPMLAALVDGFYQYYRDRQITLELK